MGLRGSPLQWLWCFLYGHIRRGTGWFLFNAWLLTLLSPIPFNTPSKLLREVADSLRFIATHMLITLTSSIPSTSTVAVSVLNICLLLAKDWVWEWTHCRLSWTRKRCSPSEEREQGVNPYWNRVTLSLKTLGHSLGVFVDSSLSLNPQVSAVARSAFVQLLLHQ